MKIVHIKDCPPNVIKSMSYDMFYEYPFLYAKMMKIHSPEELEIYFKNTFPKGKYIPSAYVALVNKNGEDVFAGFIALQYNGMFRNDEYIKKVPWLTNIYVEKQYRNRGIAKLLISHALRVLKDNNEIDAFLWTHEPKLVLYYATCGFSPFKEVTLAGKKFIMMKTYVNTPPSLFEPVHFVGMIVIIILFMFFKMIYKFIKGLFF